MPCANLVIVGSSTGGPKILRRFFNRMPSLQACVLVVQHMPHFVNESLCRTIGAETPMPTALVTDGVRLAAGQVLVAPSDVHSVIFANTTIRLRNSEKVQFVRPSIDVTMKSVHHGFRKLCAVILTGMGRDGAEGIVHIRSLGGETFAQDRHTCVIYGMPKAAAETGAVQHVMEPEQIRDTLIERFAAAVPA
ncbi:MAG: CheB methylesterase domain-containing protein [Phycisphaerae bacterium]